MESIHVPALWTALRQTRNKAQGNFHPGFGTTLRIRCPRTMGSHRSLSGASTRQSAVVWGAWAQVWAQVALSSAGLAWAEWAWAQARARAWAVPSSAGLARAEWAELESAKALPLLR